ncbi:MAG: methionyl-tRNA formyltransferase [Polaromonas sp.]|nr:methionyl-tRNA formyltransferase [Polaromonas sp.]
MRVIFAGTPEFARVALEKLHTAGFEIALVLTQPDRPAGRGMKLQASAVKQWAVAQHIPVAQPRSLRLDGKYSEDAAAASTAIEAANADVMVVAAYGLILPQWVLDVPRLGCLNIHGSVLPRWRGAAPIHRAIEAGDSQTGVTIMQMDAGLDTGDMLLLQTLPIGPHDSTDTLHDQLAELGGQMIVQALELAASGSLQPVPQPTEGISYAHKIDKREAAIDWAQPAATLERRIRAFNPFPVACSALNGETIKFWRAEVLTDVLPPSSAAAGEVLAASAEGVDVAAVGGVLRVSRLQKAGGKPLDAADFLRGFEIHTGQHFSSAPAMPQA